MNKKVKIKTMNKKQITKSLKYLSVFVKDLPNFLIDNIQKEFYLKTISETRRIIK